MPARFQSLAGRLGGDARCDGPEASGCPPKRARMPYGRRGRESGTLPSGKRDKTPVAASWAPHDANRARVRIIQPEDETM